MKETVFYIVGIALAVSAVIVSFIGLKSEKFPGRASVAVILVFAVGAVGAATFAVLYSKEHAEHREHELEKANAEYEGDAHGVPDQEAVEDDILKEDEEDATAPGAKEGESGGEEKPSGAASTLEVIADESALAYKEKSLEAKAGEVEIDFNNPSPIGHDVAIEKDGEEIGATEVIANAEDSATVELEPGEYVFYCTVPGHREAGMEGPLTVR